MVTATSSAAVSVAVNTTAPPSDTSVAEADSDTVGRFSSSTSRTTIEDGLPAVTVAGSVPSATVSVSSSLSVSWFVWIVPVAVDCPAGTVTEDGAV